MTERPMLFSGPMVLALLAGSKTQTRRIVKPAPDWERPEPMSSTTAEGWQGPLDFAVWADNADPEADVRRSPYGGPGDSLWVKETWRPFLEAVPEWDLSVRYQADGAFRTIKDGEFGERDWTMPKAAATGNVSPLFMPRWASRLNLNVTGIRVERLQDISEADIIAEGVTQTIIGTPRNPHRMTYRASFMDLWESINGPDSWAANPWVWVVTFDVAEAGA